MSDVALVKCLSYQTDEVESCINELVSLIGGFEKYIKSGDKVFIKLNCVGPFSSDRNITTHPTVFEAIVKGVMKITANIIVGDNPATKDIVYTMKKNGLYDIANKYNLKIVDGKKTTKITNSNAKLHSEFEVSEEMVSADVLINVPKLKTHALAYITCAEKNLFGFIYGLNKAGWHVKSNNPWQFGEAINDLYGAILNCYENKVILNICDGIVGLEGEGPSTGGTVKKAGALLCSLDAVSLDRVALSVMGLDEKRSFITNIASLRGYGAGDIENINILGSTLDEFSDISFIPPKDSLGNIGLKILRIKPLRNLLLEHPVIDHTKCIKCGECAKICPPHTMKIDKGSFPHLRPNSCIRCWCCAEVCPQDAIKKSKRPLIGRIAFYSNEKNK